MTDTPSGSNLPFIPPSDVIARRVGSTMVLVQLNTNHIYELNATGARIWELMTAGMDRAQVVATLGAEFDADRSTIEAAVDDLLTALHREELA